MDPPTRESTVIIGSTAEESTYQSKANPTRVTGKTAFEREVVTLLMSLERLKVINGTKESSLTTLIEVKKYFLLE
jgi:hypothetical protein